MWQWWLEKCSLEIFVCALSFSIDNENWTWWWTSIEWCCYTSLIFYKIIVMPLFLFLFDEEFSIFIFHRFGSYEYPVKQINTQYKQQPGKIENYTPGNSSISDKEAKQVTPHHIHHVQCIWNKLNVIFLLSKTWIVSFLLLLSLSLSSFTLFNFLSNDE